MDDEIRSENLHPCLIAHLVLDRRLRDHRRRRWPSLSPSQAPAVYEASSLIAVTKPRYSIQFDARFETTNLDPAYRVYPDLATSDGLLRGTAGRMQATEPDLRHRDAQSTALLGGCSAR